MFQNHFHVLHIQKYPMKFSLDRCELMASKRREKEKNECKKNDQETFFGLLLNKYKCSIKYENATVHSQSILPVTLIIKRLYRHEKYKHFVFALLSTTQFTHIYVGCRCYSFLLFVSSVHFFGFNLVFRRFSLGYDYKCCT